MHPNRLGVSGITTNRWRLEEDVQAYARMGVQHIGVWAFKCEGLHPEEVRKLIESHDMHVSNVCFGGLFTQDTEAERMAAIENTKELIDFTQSIGADTLLLVSGAIHKHTLAQALDYVRFGLEAVVPYAEQRNVHLGLEALHPTELTQWSVVNTVSLSLKLVDEFASNHIGVFLDTYNNGWDYELSNLIPRCAGKIKGVHLADWRNPTRSFTDRTLPGRGVLPIRDIVQKIEETGYSGTYDLELFSDELWDSDYENFIREYQVWYNSLD